MSAMNVVVQDQEVHLFTDAALYNVQSGGRVGGIGSKVHLLPHHNAVVAATGWSWVSLLIAVAAAERTFCSFSELASEFAGLIEESANKAFGTIEPWGTYEIILAGMNDAGSAEAHLFREAKAKPSTVQSRSVTDYRTPRSPLIDSIPTPTGASVAKGGLAILEGQRQMVCRDADDRAFVGHLIGGFAQHTKISVDGINTRVLRQWPDHIGQLIDPFVRGSSTGSLFGGAEQLLCASP